MARKKKKTNKSASPGLLIALFLVITFSVVLLLEYLDYSKNRPAFLLDKILKKEKKIKIPDFITELRKSLNREKIDYHHFIDREGHHHFKFATGKKYHDLHITKIKKVAAKCRFRFILAEVQKKEDRTIFLYKAIAGKTSHVVLVNRLEPVNTPPAEISKDKKKEKSVKKKPVIKEDNSPKIAFIIDDIGEYELGIRSLASLKIPITASILPDSPHAARESALSKKYSAVEAMLHIPMQPKNSSQGNYNGGKVLKLDSSSTVIRQLLTRAKRIVPSARGLNNHQGSLATSNRNLMKKLMKEVRKSGLYFIDSRTDSDTVAAVVAKEYGVPVASRAVFLDHKKSYEHSMEQIRILVDTAVIKGHAIAIGHPFETTIKAIKDSIRYIKKRKIKIVFASRLVK